MTGRRLDFLGAFLEVFWLEDVADGALSRAAGAPGALQLESSVGDMELIPQVMIDPLYDFSAAADALVLNHQVSAQGMYVRCKRPDMDVMHLFHAGNGFYHIDNLVHGHVSRHRLKENIHGFFQKPPGSHQDNQADNHCDNRVDDAQFRINSNDDTASDNAYRGNGVTHNMPESCSDIKVAMVGLSQQEYSDEVSHQTDGSYHQHQRSVNRRRVEESLVGFVKDIGGNQRQQSAVSQRRHNFNTVVAEGLIKISRPRRHID